MACLFDTEIHQGAVAPYALFYDVTSDSADFDLSTATGGSFDIQRQSGKTGSWSAVIDGVPTATALTLKHTFVAGDVGTLETITVVPRITTPSGDFIGRPRTLRVKGLFE